MRRHKELDDRSRRVVGYIEQERRCESVENRTRALSEDG